MKIQPTPNATPTSSPDKFILRLHDEGLRKHLKVRAAMNERTLNAEILFLVKRGLAAVGDPFVAAEAATTG